jgi:Tfp pilus assembly protein FimT
MTLIELVVVLVLVGIMASVVAPSIVALDRPSAALNVADRIEALVRFGRTAAIERAQKVELTIDPETGRFWFDLPTLDSAGTIVLSEGSALVARAKRVHVRFEPNGDASIDETLSVRQGGSTLGIVIPR